MTRPARGPSGRFRLALVSATAMLLLTSVAPAYPKDAVRFTATLDGRDTNSLDANRPLRLRSDQPLEVTIAVTNDGDTDVTVRSVRLEGRVIGLAFFAYETRLDVTVPRRSTEQRRFPIETLDLADQANGLLPARLVLLDGERDVVAVERFATEVDGSLLSIYGVFGILVMAITGVLVAAIVVRLASHRLSPNRWSRGIRFATAGAGIGLALTFSLSALGVLLPEASRWLPMVLVCTGMLFVVGYLTPSTYTSQFDEEVPVDDQALEGVDPGVARSANGGR